MRPTSQNSSVHFTDSNNVFTLKTQNHSRERSIVFFSGRLFRREKLLRSLGNVALDTDDHTLLLLAFQKWQAATHHHVVGAYTAIIVDSDELYLFRGVYDSPGLYYCLHQDGLTISTDARQLLTKYSASVSINSDSVRHFLAYSMPVNDAGFIQEVSALTAGQGLKVRNDQIHHLPHYEPLARCIPIPRDTQTAAHQWLQAYQDAVQDASKAIDNIGLFLSGGLDSGALATIAQLQQTQLEAISLSLPHYPDEDEWFYAEHLSKKLGLAIHRVEITSRCFDDLLSQPVSLFAPGINPYQGMINQGYDLAASRGLKNIWFGTGGDELYAPKRNLLRDLWQHRDMGTFIRTLCSARAREIPHIYKTWLNTVLHRQPRTMRYPQYILGNKNGTLNTPYTTSSDIPVESRYHRAFLFQSSHLNAQENERTHSAPRGLTRIHPCIHPSLIEQGLITPAYQAHSLTHNKTILRTALTDYAPAELRRRGRVGVLQRYYYDGWNKNLNTIRDVLLDPAATWPQFVDRRIVDSALHGSQPEYTMLLLNCLALELWLNTLRAEKIDFRLE